MANPDCTINIKQFNLENDNPRQYISGLFDVFPGGEGQGDHSTAWVVFRDMLLTRTHSPNGDGLTARELIGEPFEDNGRIMEIIRDFRQLPGYEIYINQSSSHAQRYLPQEYLKAISEREDRVNQKIQLLRSKIWHKDRNIQDVDIMDMLNSLMELRNILPLSAFRFGGTGGAEANAANKLIELNGQMAQQGSSLTREERNQLLTKSMALLDANRMKQEFDETARQINDNEIEQWAAQADMENIPGLPDIWSILQNNGKHEAITAVRETEQQIINQHLMSLASAYPNLRTLIGSDNFQQAFLNRYYNL